jgi:pimeloyl-ACP methyl ester carboxylesterase
VDGRKVTGWRWGRGPLVYLVHGWGGTGGRLAAFVSPLVAQGHAVVAFDAPGHGGSRLAMSSMPEFARALLAVADLCGPAHAVIGHSLGAAASALAVAQGLAPKRLVLIAPPADPGAFLIPFAGALHLSPEVMARLQARSERRLRFRWTDLDLRRMQPPHPVPLLVVHDRDDRTVPIENGAAVAASWKGRLLETSGMGHAGVLRHPDVVRAVLSFVAEEEDAPEPLPLSEGSALEWSLFHPAARV